MGFGKRIQRATLALVCRWLTAIAVFASGSARAETPSDAWGAASQFERATAADIIAEVEERVIRAAKASKRPVVVFDLDSTLFDNGTRQAEIAHEFAKANAAAKQLYGFESKSASFSLESMLASVGITSPDLIAAYRPFWRERFFADGYVRHDRAYPNAAANVVRIYRATPSVQVVYLTGRHRAYIAKTDQDLFPEGMEAGTRAVIVRDGLPLGDRAVLMMKDSFGEPDEDYKRRVASSLQRLGTVVATFDNEPANVAVFADKFPSAVNVWVDTIHSSRPAPPVKGAYKFGGGSNDSANWPGLPETTR